jgi:hypothetical protein
VDVKALTKLERLLKKFPEIWTHTRESQTIEGNDTIFHHVDYRSGVEGKPRVRLVSHVSSDMCELLVTLKSEAPELIAIARKNPEPNPPRAKSPSKRKAS